MARQIIRLEKPPEVPFGFAKMVTAGPVVEVTGYCKDPKPPPVKWLDDDTYMLTAGPKEGLVETCQHGETRADSKQSVSRTLSHIRALINANVTVPQNCRWVTLTYRENMTDAKRLYKDFEKFWKRFLYWCKEQGHGKPEYITVIEPQGRGAWHVHAFFIWDGPAPFIDNNAVMEKLWSHGFTKTKAVKDTDNMGAYFSAYLADMELDEVQNLSDKEKISALQDGCDVIEKEYTDDSGKRVKKRFLKGARLALYPPGMNLYRRSRGIKDPEVEKMTYGEAKRKVRLATLTFQRVYEISDTDKDTKTAKTLNFVTKEYYNTKWRNCQ